MLSILRGFSPFSRREIVLIARAYISQQLTSQRLDFIIEFLTGGY